MSEPSDSKFEYLFRLELRGKPIPDSSTEKLEILKKRLKKVRMMMVLNVIFFIAIISSYILGFSELPEIFYYLLGTVFLINVALQFVQQKRITEAVHFYS